MLVRMAPSSARATKSSRATGKAPLVKKALATTTTGSRSTVVRAVTVCAWPKYRCTLGGSSATILAMTPDEPKPTKAIARVATEITRKKLPASLALSTRAAMMV